MNHYTYMDYKDRKKVIFECDAMDILEADELLFKATGIVATKANNIGCAIS